MQYTTTKKFSTAKFLNDKTTLTVWDTLTKVWPNAYFGCADTMAFDQDTQFTSVEWNSLPFKHGIQSQRLAVDIHNCLGVAER